MLQGRKKYEKHLFRPSCSPCVPPPTVRCRLPSWEKVTELSKNPLCRVQGAITHMTLLNHDDVSSTPVRHCVGLTSHDVPTTHQLALLADVEVNRLTSVVGDGVNPALNLNAPLDLQQQPLCYEDRNE